MSTDARSSIESSLTQTLVLSLGTILFLVLVYLMLDILPPFILLASVIFLLYPFRASTYVRRVIILSVLLFFYWLLDSLWSALTPFIIACVLVYILNPAVDALSRKMPRWIAAAIVVMSGLALIILFFILIIPGIVSQVGDMIANISGAVRQTVESIKDGSILQTLGDMGIPIDRAREFISDELPGRMEDIVRSVVTAVFSFATGVSSMVGQLLNLIIIPFVTYYLLKDYPRILITVSSNTPAHRRETLDRYARKVDEIVGQYIRGTLIISIIIGVATGVGLSIVGVRYALLLGILTGVLNLIPYAGFYASLLVAAIIALVSGDPIIGKLLSVIALYVGLNMIETTVLSPRIIGPRVGLHPVTLILSLVVFGWLFGFVGLLIAVPAAAIIIMVYKTRKAEMVNVPSEREA